LKNVAVVAAAIVVVGLGWLTYGSFGDEPGGTTAQAVADKAANTKAVKAPRARKEISADAELTRMKLSEPMPAAHWADKLPLKEVLRLLEKNHGFPKFAINNAAFTLNPGAEGVHVDEFPIDVPNVPGISKDRLLRLILDQVPTGDAAFLVRPNVIEITVNDVTKPEFQFVDGTFVDVPLEEVLAELSDRTGITILIDARAKEKAKTPITARFQHETNLATAVRLLADMADLKLVVVDRILYVTLPSNKADFPAGNLPGFKQKRADAAAA
jgi:hypothetical protein